MDGTCGSRLDCLLDELIEVEATIAGACARRARVLVELTSLRLAAVSSADQGVAMRSLVAEISCAVRVPEGTVLRQVNDAETLVRSLPATCAALSSGEISYRHAQAMVSHAVSIPDAGRAAFEDALLPTACVTTGARFDQLARRERERRHPESIDARVVAAQAERSVRLEAGLDGMAWLICHLPAVAAHAIDDRLDRAARAARGVDGPMSGMTHSQVRADTFTALLLGASPPASAASPGAGADSDSSRTTTTTGEPGDAGDHLRRVAAAIVPTVVLTVPVLSLLGHGDAAAELLGHGPIDLPTARALCARAPSFLRILTDPDTGQTLGVGRHRYRPPADLRLALQLADETCRFPNCGRGASRCELDHTTAWADGGTTAAHNLHHLCPKHHHLKHDSSGWSVRPASDRAASDRALEWVSPTGRVHHTHAPPPAAGRRVRFVAK